MSRINKRSSEPTYFICSHCGRGVEPSSSGNRNHCPSCLRSLHVDIRKGDRMSGCRGIMDPVAIWVKESGEWAILHRCRSCGFIRANRVAADDSEPALLALAALPVGRLPFLSPGPEPRLADGEGAAL